MGRFVSVFLLFFLVLLVFYFGKSDSFKVESPVPGVFGASKDSQPPANGWFPITKKLPDPGLGVSARSAILVDYGTSEVIFSKSPKERMPAASTIKIMTALLALEKSKLGDTFVVSEKAYKAGENSMNLSPGEKLTLEELLHGLILVSGNDAAVAIAENVAGSEEKFVEMMNERVKQLGLSDTKFVNASGLDVDGEPQYSTAYDMAIIARYLWENHPEFRKISETYHWVLDATANHKGFDLYSDTNLLTSYPGVRGIKPGFTWEAGWCLVTYAENNGKKLIGVILGSSDRRGEMKELLDFGFSRYGIEVPHPDLDL